MKETMNRKEAWNVFNKVFAGRGFTTHDAVPIVGRHYFASELGPEIGFQRGIDVSKFLFEKCSKGELYRTAKRIRCIKGTVYIYSFNKSPEERDKEYVAYVLKCWKRYVPLFFQVYEEIKATGFVDAADLLNRFGDTFRIHKLNDLVFLGALKKYLGNGRCFYYSPGMMSEEGVIKLAGDGDNALNPVPRRNDLFGSVSDMIRAGWCYKDRVSLTMIRIRPEWKVGIPDEDMVLTPEEVVRFLGAIEPFNEPYRLLFEFFFRVGARISQMVEVRVCDLDFNKQTVFIQPRKEGNAFYRKLDAEFMFRLKDWIDHYGLVDEDYLFCVRREGIPRNRPCTWKKISSYTNRKVAQEVLQYYAAKAGLDYRYVDSYGILRHRISPHTIKKTFLSIVYSHCKDSLLTSLTTGNKTTACVEKHYIKIPAAKRNAVVTQALQEIFGVPEVEIRALTEPPAT